MALPRLPPAQLKWVSGNLKTSTLYPSHLHFFFLFFFLSFGGQILKTWTFKRHTHKKLESLHACTVRSAGLNRPRKNLFCPRLALSTEIAYNNQNYKYKKGDQDGRVGRQWVHLPWRTYQTTTAHRATLAEISLGKAEQLSTTKAVKRDPHGVWLECKLIQPLWETLWRFLRKVKMESLYDPAITTLGIYLKKMKTLIPTPLFIAALFITAKMWIQPKCPLVNEWDEADLEYICNRY